MAAETDAQQLNGGVNGVSEVRDAPADGLHTSLRPLTIHPGAGGLDHVQ